MCIGYNSSYIVKGDLSQLLSLAFAIANNHKTPVDKQVAAIVCDFYDAAEHFLLPQTIALFTYWRNGDVLSKCALK